MRLSNHIVRGGLIIVMGVAVVATGVAPGAQSETTPSPPTSDVAGDEISKQRESAANVTRAMLELTLACMKQDGEVERTATAKQVLGYVDRRGHERAPVAPVPASERCVGAAHGHVITALRQPGTSAERIESLRHRVATGMRVRAEDVRADTAVGDAVTGEAGAQRCGGVGPKKYVKKMNGFLDSRRAFFASHSRAKKPCWFNWSTDLCSNSPDSGPWFNFKFACRRHDFGYRNLKDGEKKYKHSNLWRKHNKAVADTQFRKDTYRSCRSSDRRAHRQRSLCTGTADAYVSAVRLLSPNTTGLWKKKLRR